MNIQALAQEIYAINKANGWHDGEPRSWAEICMLIESEIGGEAVEALRDPKHAVTEIWYREDGKPEGFVTEIADGVIRLLDGMVEREIDEHLGKGVGEPCFIVGTSPYSLICHIRWMGRQISKIDNCDAMSNIPGECKIFIAFSLALILSLGHDPEKVIREKMEYNRTKRGHRHGGKRL